MRNDLEATQAYLKTLNIQPVSYSNIQVILDMEVSEEPIKMLDDSTKDVFVVDISDDRLLLPPMRAKCAIEPEKWVGGPATFTGAKALVSMKTTLAEKKLYRVLRVWPYSLAYQFAYE